MLEALLSLVNDGNLRPTAEQVAERADVSVRSVFRHMSDRDALDRALVELHVARTGDLFDFAPMQGDRSQRVAALIEHRCRLYEVITPVRRAVRVHGPFGSVLRDRVELVNGMLRAHVIDLFASELDHVDPTRRPVTEAALEAATSWSTWEQLRHDQGLDPSAAGAAMSATVEALLS